MKNMRDCRFLLTCTRTSSSCEGNWHAQKWCPTSLRLTPGISNGHVPFRASSALQISRVCIEHTSAYSTFTGPSETPVVTDSADQERLLGFLPAFATSLALIC